MNSGFGFRSGTVHGPGLKCGSMDTVQNGGPWTQCGFMELVQNGGGMDPVQNGGPWTQYKMGIHRRGPKINGAPWTQQKMICPYPLLNTLQSAIISFNMLEQ